jgi:PST family polysaccharide transporter
LRPTVASNGDNIQGEVNRGLAWVGLASSTVGILDIVALGLILAIWIPPGEYGVAALAITLFPVLDQATDMGLSAAVIQRDDHSEDKISTVFWLNLAMSLVMFAGLGLLVGPALGSLHGHPIVGYMLTAYGAKLVWQNAYFMPAALMRRELRFKELSVIRICANIAEFTSKVGFAAAGFGIWCFVLGPLCRVLVTGVGIQICHPWRPRFVLKIREALDWAVFGFKTSASQILFRLYTNVDYQIVGYYFGDVANGYYRLAYDIVLEPCRVIGEVIIQIAFPAFAKLKHFKDRLIEQFIAFTRMNLVIMLGFLGVVFVAANELLLTYDAKWAPATTALQILCAVGVLRALSFVIPPLLDGIGKPTLTLIYTSVAAVVLPSMFLAAGMWAAPECELFAAECGRLAGTGEYLSAAIAEGVGHPELSLFECVVPAGSCGSSPMPAGSEYLAVAIAWAIGYPIAFAVLVVMALAQLRLSAFEYLKRTMGIPACSAVAIAAGLVTRWALSSMPAWVSLLAIIAVMTGTFLLLLAYFQDISPRGVARALKGEKPGDGQ